MIIEKLKQLELNSISRGIPIIGNEKGSWLYDQVTKFKPVKILELGTANGYSGIILGSSGAELVTIEQNKTLANEAIINFKSFNLKAKVIIGDCVEEIKKLNEKFDLIFIDFAKNKYLNVLEDCIRLINEKYPIIADNITFEGCQDFKLAILRDKRIKSQIINIKDGLSISIKR